MAHDVFISYSTKDKNTAIAVCAGLENEGIRCWMAPRDILASENYDDAIVRAIYSARIVVVIFSSNIFQSQFVKSELERAFSKGLIIAPFRIEAVEPEGGLELYLGRRHWLDAMTPPMEKHIHSLAVTIQAMLAAQNDSAQIEGAVPFANPARQVPDAPTSGNLKPQTASKPALPAWIPALGILGAIALIVLAFLLAKNWLAPASSAAPAPTPTSEMTTESRKITPAAVLPPVGTERVPSKSPVPATSTPALMKETPTSTIKLSGAWQKVSELPRLVNGFAVDPTNPKLVLAGSAVYRGSATVYKSEDGGLKWQPSSSGLNNLGAVALAFSAGKAPVLFAISDKSDEIYASSDRGQTWKVRGKTGLKGTFGGKLIPSPTDPKVLYDVTFEGSARSDDGGQTWQPLGEGLPKDNSQVLVMSLAFDPIQAGVMYAGTGGFVGKGHGVYKSIDGGENWTPCNKGMLDIRISAVAVDPRDPQVILAGSDNGDLFKSSDGGQTWTNLKDRLVLREFGEPREIRSIQFDTATGLIYLLADNSGLLYSGDGGNKWRLIGIPPGTNQPGWEALAVVLGDSPTFLLSQADDGGVWLFGLQP